MFFNRNSNAEAVVQAINRSQAVIEFNLDGTIITANPAFLNAMGYSLDEIKGEHHRMFVDPEYARSKEYEEFWQQLRKGEFYSREYRRLAKGGREVWIQASYNPILDSSGKPVKVIKFATDITQQKMKNTEFEGKINAIEKSQAVIEFNLDGIITSANPNFLGAVGYSLDEIKGKHHRMFVSPSYAESQEYKEFWNKLRRGEYSAGEYQRFGKGGKEIWIQASYNPIFDANGKPFKVVKYATDITQEKLRNADYAGQIAAIGRSQAVIEFTVGGIILNANANFLGAVGYSLEEIKGQHHQIFVAPDYVKTDEYKQFWAQLAEGKFFVAEYKRFGKGNKEIWIQASYNPIFDMNGKAFKVVKYATDITSQVNARIESGKLTQEMSRNIASVAAAAEQMTAAVAEISKNMSRSKAAVDGIASKTKYADEMMAKLSDTAKSMEAIVELIRNVSGQVNLLALNATIEAARAGEAGKGFAVVASEVKNLATQTSKATDEIAMQISALQSAASEATQSTVAINQAASSVSESVNGVASAIEEQSAVTKEIAVSMNKASDGIANISECIKRIAKSA